MYPDIGIKIVILVILFFSIVVHEYFHGYIALRCGDPTAKYAGRLTFNPIPHIDIMGTIIVPLFLVLSGSSVYIGWAKPVPVNPYNFRNPGIDNVKVSAAGPLSNFALAVIFAILIIVTSNLLPELIIVSFIYGIKINLLLAVFNLIPVPPLDGSHILEYFLPYNLKIEYNKIKQYGFIILLLLIFVIPQFFGILLSIVGFFESIIYFFIRMFAF